MTTQSFNAAALVNEVCAALGKSFAVVKEHSIGNPKEKYGCWTFVVESPELGIAKLFFRVEEFGARFESSVTWPMVQHRQITASSYVRSEIAEAIGGYPQAIGVSTKRAPAAIAADMRKRLIPRILAVEPLVSNGIVKEIKQENEARATAQGLSLALGYHPDHFERRAANGANNSFPVRLDSKSGAPASATFQVHENSSIDLKLSGLTKAQAKAVIKALKING